MVEASPKACEPLASLLARRSALSVFGPFSRMVDAFWTSPSFINVFRMSSAFFGFFFSSVFLWGQPVAILGALVVDEKKRRVPNPSTLLLPCVINIIVIKEKRKKKRKRKGKLFRVGFGAKRMEKMRSGLVCTAGEEEGVR